MTEKDILDEAKEDFKEADEFEQENRRLWLDDVRFARLEEQWPEEWKAKRMKEGRPCLTINRLPSFIRQVTNDARQNRPAIKCHPTDDKASEEVAEILNGLIRNIEYSSSADVAYDTAMDGAVCGGFGYFRVATEYASNDAFEQDIRIERITNPLNVWGDPKSRAADSSDWNSAFISDMLEEEDFDKKYPGADKSSFDASGGNDNESWYSEKRIRLAEYWTREEVEKTLLKLSNGEVMYEESFLKMKDIFDVLQVAVTGTRQSRSYKVTQRIITGSEVLETNKWAGKYIPIIPVYGDEVNVEGKRHFISLIRGAKDSQMMLNLWRSATTELVALAPKAPFIGRKGAFDSDSNKWATANTDTHAYIEFDGPEMPQRQPFAGVPAGALQEALNASDDMKAIIGIYDASLGARSNETSGRAILARQREGDVSTFHFTDNLSRAIRHAGRVIVDLIPSVYDTARIIRVIHEDGKNESVRINQPHQAELPGQEQGQAGGQAMPTAGVGETDQQEQQEFMQGVVKLYDLTVGKYDVTCEAGPSFTTKREEAAQQMMSFVQSFPASASLIGDLIAKNLDWPGADDIADRLKAMLPQQVQGQNPQVQQLTQQLQQVHGQAQQAVGKLSHDMQTLKDDKSLEARKLDIDAYNAETDRLKAMGGAMGPEQVQALVMQTLQNLLASPDILPGQMPQGMPPQAATPQPQVMPPGPMPPPGMPIPNQPPQGGFFTPGAPAGQPSPTP